MLANLSDDIHNLPEALQPATQNLIERFCEAVADETKASDVTRQCLQSLTTENKSALIRAFTSSDYLAQACIDIPDLLPRLLDEADLGQVYEADAYSIKLAALFEAVEDEAQFSKDLRHLRRQEMVRLIWRDLNRQSDMVELTQDLSNLADASIEYALKWGVKEAQAKYGKPLNAAGEEQHMAVIGMGKLGACELNLSSDIDLIFVYGQQGETQGGKRSVSNQEFFLFVARVLIRLLDTHSVEGFVFRVDMRLRPYGDSGPLICTMDAMAQYYQEQGREWERYAMIKARIVAGDQVLGAEFFDLIRSFVFRKYIDFGAIDAMRQMKGLINAEVRRKQIAHNIKVGPGGIREIEFIGQVFQLIHGGKHPGFQTRPILNVLALLEAEGHMESESVASLIAAYFFLRNTEHAIQAYQDKQTQLLPEDELGQLRLAYAMGYDNWQDFESTLDAHRANVRLHFDDVIADPKDHESEYSDLAQWQDFWMRISATFQIPDDENEFLYTQRFLAPSQFIKQLVEFSQSHSFRYMDETSRARLNQFMPRLFSALSQAKDKELVLWRVFPLIKAILRRSAYLVLLMENPDALTQLIRLCEASEWIAEQLAQMPVLLDELLDVSTLYSPPEQQALQDELRQQLLRIPEEDFEGQLDCLRHFKSAHMLRVAAAEVTGALSLMKVSDYLTYIAETILEHAFRLAWRFMTDKYGRPMRTANEVCDPDFIVVAYGKLGGIELSYGSDLDVVFVHDADERLSTDGKKSIDNTVFFLRLGQRMIHILDTQMVSGQLYEVDVRLRPSGASGPLVPSLKAFEKYQRNDAWTWEHQALVRTRVVAGCARLKEKFDETRAALLAQSREVQPLKEEVAKMRKKMLDNLATPEADRIPVGLFQSGIDEAAWLDDERIFNIKHDPGGIVDIEFIVQFVVLAHGAEHASLYAYSDNVRILEAMEATGLISAEGAMALTDAYLLYRSVIHQLALSDGDKTLTASQYSEYNLDKCRQSVVQLWAEFFG